MYVLQDVCICPKLNANLAGSRATEQKSSLQKVREYLHLRVTMWHYLVTTAFLFVEFTGIANTQAHHHSSSYWKIQA